MRNRSIKRFTGLILGVFLVLTTVIPCFVTPVYGLSDDYYDYDTFTEEDEEKYNINRLYGEDRYETSYMVADELKKLHGLSMFDAIVVACGTNYPDALSGSYLAQLNKAPIILTTNYKQPNTVSYIRSNLKPKGKVYILGGTGVISASLDRELKSLGYTVKRLGGIDRYETNILILKECYKIKDFRLRPIKLITGEDWVDALITSNYDTPTLLVKKRGLTRAQKDWIVSIKGTTRETRVKFTIYGTPGTFNDGLVETLKTLTKGSIGKYQFNKYHPTDVDDALDPWHLQKIEDPDKLTVQEKSMVVADGRWYRYGSGFITNEKYLFATASNWPDTLSAGPLAAKYGSPIILLNNSETGSFISYACYRGMVHGNSDTRTVPYYVVGGPGVLYTGTLLWYKLHTDPDTIV